MVNSGWIAHKLTFKKVIPKSCSLTWVAQSTDLEEVEPFRRFLDVVDVTQCSFWRDAFISTQSLLVSLTWVAREGLCTRLVHFFFDILMVHPHSYYLNLFLNILHPLRFLFLLPLHYCIGCPLFRLQSPGRCRSVCPPCLLLTQAPVPPRQSLHKNVNCIFIQNS